MESLEDRRLLTADVLWNPATGALTVTGGAGDDEITIGSAADGSLQINGQAPTSGLALQTSGIVSISVSGGGGGDEIDLSDVDTADFSSLTTVVAAGDAGDDTIVGSALSDTIVGGPGDDSLTGLGGDDALIGAEGSDFLQGGADSDTLEGGGGQDYLFGDGGSDELDGAEGDDVLSGGSGADDLSGGDGDDLLLGGPGDDNVLGGDGLDSIEFVDDLEDAFTTTGVWSASTNLGVNGLQRWADQGDGSNRVSWVFNDLAAGSYEVLTTWQASASLPTLASDAPFAVIGAEDGDHVMHVDQRADPIGPTVADQPWHSLGVFNAQNGRLEVQASNLADGTVIADAVRIVPISDAFEGVAISFAATDVAIGDATVGGDFQLGLHTATTAVSQWMIDWGDGTQSTESGIASEATHQFQVPGSVTVTVTAELSSGATRAFEKNVFVQHEPGANLLANESFEADQLAPGVSSAALASISNWSGFSNQKVLVGRDATTGLQHVSLGSDHASTITQTINTIPGQRYVFSAKHRGAEDSGAGISLMAVDEAAGSELGFDRFQSDVEWGSSAIVFTAESAATKLLIGNASSSSAAMGPGDDPPTGDPPYPDPPIDEASVVPVLLETTEDTRIESHVVLSHLNANRPTFSQVEFTPTGSGFALDSQGILTFAPEDMYQGMAQGGERVVEVSFVTNASNYIEPRSHRYALIINGENDVPSVSALTVRDNHVVQNEQLVLELANAADVDGRISSAMFFRDDGDGVYAHTDQFLGIDRSSVDGWSHTVAAGDWETENSVYFAFVTDNRGGGSEILEVDIQNPLDLGGLFVSPALYDFTEQVANGGFETPQVVDQQSFGKGDVPSWNPLPGEPPIELQHERQPNSSNYVWLDAQDALGNQWAELDSTTVLTTCESIQGFEGGEAGGPRSAPSCTPTQTVFTHSSSSIVQTANVTPGQPHLLSFDFAAAPNTGVLDNIMRVQVREENPFASDSRVIRANKSYLADQHFEANSVVWYEESLVFTPQTDTVELVFSDIGHPDEQGTFLDDVSLVALQVPIVSLIAPTTPILESDPAIVTLQLNTPADADATFFYRLTEGTAEKAADFEETPFGIVTIPKGETSYPLTLPIVDDNVRELDGETINVEFFFAENAAIDGAMSAQIVIDDDDVDPASLTVGDVWRAENSGDVSVPITIQGNVGEVTAVFRVVDGKADGTHTPDEVAVLGVDYTVPGLDPQDMITLTFDALGHQTTTTFDVDFSNNNIFELDEYFHVELVDVQPSYSVESVVPNNKGNVVIENDDRPARLTITPPLHQIKETVGQIDVNVRLTGEVEGTYHGDLNLVPGHHTAPLDEVQFPHAIPGAGGDYTTPSPLPFSLTSNSSQSFTIDLVSDGDNEFFDKYFFAEIAPTGTPAVIRQSRVSQVKLFNDLQEIEYTVLDAYPDDPDALGLPNAPAQIIIQLSEPVTTAGSDQWIEFDYTTRGFTAAPNADYEEYSSMVTIWPGQSQGVIDLTLLADGFAGFDEQFFVEITDVRTSSALVLADRDTLGYATVSMQTGTGSGAAFSTTPDSDDVPAGQRVPFTQFETQFDFDREEQTSFDGLPAGLFSGRFALDSTIEGGPTFFNDGLRLGAADAVRFKFPGTVASTEDIVSYYVRLTLKEQDGTVIKTGTSAPISATDETRDSVLTAAHSLSFADLPDLETGVYVLQTMVIVSFIPIGGPTPQLSATYHDFTERPYLVNNGDIYRGMGSPLALDSLTRVYPYAPNPTNQPNPQVLGLALFRNDKTTTYYGNSSRPNGVFSRLAEVTNPSLEAGRLRMPPGTAAAQQIGYKLTRKDSTSVLYDINGRQIFTVDSYGNATRFNYVNESNLSNDNYWLPKSVVDPFGTETSYIYDANGTQLEEVREFAGAAARVTELTYGMNDANQVVTVMYPAPEAGGSRPTEVFEFNPRNQIEFHTHVSGRVDKYGYDPTYFMLNALHEGFISESDEGVVAEAHWTFSTALESLLGAVNAGADIMASVTDPRGHTTSYMMDLSGNIKEMTDALDNTYSYTYTKHNQIKEMIEPDALAPQMSGRLTTYHYDYVEATPATDHVGVLTKVEHPDGSTETWKYADARFPGISTGYQLEDPAHAQGGTAGLLRTVRYELDPEGGRVLKEILDLSVLPTAATGQGPEPDPSAKWQNPANPLDVNADAFIGPVDANIVLTEISLRQVSDPVTGVLPDRFPNGPNGNPPEYYYDVEANGSADPLDALNVINVLSSYNSEIVTEFGYTTDSDNVPRGLLEKVEDNLGRETEYTYHIATDNHHGTIEKITFAKGTVDQASTEYTYDAYRNLESVTDESGFITEYDFDFLDRLVTFIEPQGQLPLQQNPPSFSTTYTYRDDGLLETVNDNEGVITTYAYDELDRLESVTEDTGGINAVTQYHRDTMGNIQLMVNPRGNVTVYHYDPLGRMVVQLDPEPTGDFIGNSWRNPIEPKDANADGNVDVLDKSTIEAYLGGECATDPPDPITLPTWSPEFGTSYLDVNNDGVVSCADTFTSNVAPPIVSVDQPITRHMYDNLGNVIGTRDPDGGLTEYRYDERDQLRWIIEDTQDPAAVDQTMMIGPSIDPATLRDPEDFNSRPVTEFVFDAAGQLRTYVDPVLRTTRVFYDEIGRRMKVELPDVDRNELDDTDVPVYGYLYDRVGNLSRYIDAEGNVTSLAYDNRDRLNRVTEPLPGALGDHGSPVTTVSYEDNGNIKSIKEINVDRELSYMYDANARIEKVVLPTVAVHGEMDPINPTYTFGYDDEDNLLWTTDANGMLTEYRYDNLYRTEHVVENKPNTFGMVHSPGLVPSAERANRPVTTYEYLDNGLGPLERVIDPLGRELLIGYDNLDRVVYEVSADPVSGNAGWNAATGAPASDASPFTKYSHSPAGDVVGVTDAIGNHTDFQYDRLHRLIARVEPFDDQDPNTLYQDAAAFTTKFSYYASGELHTLTDPAVNTSRWTYNGLGLASSYRERLFEYDLVGNITTSTDRNGRVIEFNYDNLYQLQEEVWRSQADNSVVNTLIFDYDPSGRMVGSSQLDGTNNGIVMSTFTHDALDRIALETIDIAGLNDTVSLRREFDAVGNQRQLTSAVGDTHDFVTVREYDALQRTKALTQRSFDSQTDTAILGATGSTAVAGKHATFTYDFADKFDYVRRYSGPTPQSALVASTDYEFDLTGRIKSIRHDNAHTVVSSSLLAGIELNYDQVSRVAGAGTDIKAIDFLTGPSEDIIDFTYNERHELVGVDRPSAALDETYKYDNHGNRDEVDYTGSGGVVHYVLPPGLHSNQLQFDGVLNYQYDSEGNVTARTRTDGSASTTYIWDHRNRLTRVEERSLVNGTLTLAKTVAYQYDTYNQLVGRTVDNTPTSTGGGVSAFYIHDDAQIVMQIEVGGVSNRYLWGPTVDMILADESISSSGSAGDVDWALIDHLGSVRSWVDSDSIAEPAIDYDAFGNAIDPDSGEAALVTHLFAFTGRMLDSDTGLQNNLNRWYDAKIGRWMSEDPIGFWGGDANLYRYVGNEATRWIDPSGLSGGPPGDGGEPNSQGLPGTVAIPVAIRQRLGGPTRGEVIDSLPADAPTPSGTASVLHTGTVDGAGVGKHVVVDRNKMKPNDRVGTGGLDTCIGVAICGQNQIIAAHFTPQQNPWPTLDTYRRRLGENATAVVAGGTNSDASIVLLQQTVAKLRDMGIQPTFSNTGGIWMDQNGGTHVFTDDRR